VTFGPTVRSTVTCDVALDQAVFGKLASGCGEGRVVRLDAVAAAGALVGAVMKATRGQADATRAWELILARLGQG
jgi:aspartyl-tRNA(Asn)/glutamyl-tRNA(Gln) amidotransferase subunit B